MNKTALKTVYEHNMLSEGDAVIAAVSGGADSMALLCFLMEIKEQFSLSLYVCHVNHLLRGIDADGDEQFVKEFCKQHSIPFYLKRCDVKSLAEKSGKGFEECGRDVRYEFFNETALSIGKNVKIATAHTLSDCCETLLFNIARGCGPAGIASIAPARDNIIRPLICCNREQIEAYLKEIGQDYRTDKTNDDIAYTRNFIRHRLIPEFKKLNPSFETAVLNLTALSREQQAFFDEISEKEYAEVCKEGGIFKSELLKRNIAVIRSIITKYLRENNVAATKKRSDEIISLLEKDSFCLSVCKGGYLICKDDIIRFKKEDFKCAEDFVFEAVLGERKLADGRILSLKEISYNEFKNIKKNFPNLLKNCVNYDIIDDSFVIRNRKIGDIITIFPRNVTKTLKKLLNESKIDTDKRNIIPVLASENRVYWVEGVAVDAAAAVTKPCRVLFIEVLNKDKNGEHQNEE